MQHTTASTQQAISGYTQQSVQASASSGLPSDFYQASDGNYYSSQTGNTPYYLATDGRYYPK
jgi:hypothetical protein